MIAFGTAVTKPEEYRRFAEPGIRRAAESDSLILTVEEPGSIFENYNRLLERAAARDDLEGLVLVHQDAEIVDPELCTKLRQALSDPDVAVVGCVGAIGVRSIAWWEGSVTWASFIHRGGPGEEFPSFSWDPDDLPPYARARRGRHRGRLRDGTLALGRAHHPFRRVPRTRCTATTSTTASRCERPARRSSRPTSG